MHDLINVIKPIKQIEHLLDESKINDAQKIVSFIETDYNFKENEEISDVINCYLNYLYGRISLLKGAYQDALSHLDKAKNDIESIGNRGYDSNLLFLNILYQKQLCMFELGIYQDSLEICYHIETLISIINYNDDSLEVLNFKYYFRLISIKILARLGLTNLTNELFVQFLEYTKIYVSNKHPQTYYLYCHFLYSIGQRFYCEQLIDDVKFNDAKDIHYSLRQKFSQLYQLSKLPYYGNNIKFKTNNEVWFSQYNSTQLIENQHFAEIDSIDLKENPYYPGSFNYFNLEEVSILKSLENKENDSSDRLIALVSQYSNSESKYIRARLIRLEAKCFIHEKKYEFAINKLLYAKEIFNEIESKSDVFETNRLLFNLNKRLDNYDSQFENLVVEMFSAFYNIIKELKKDYRYGYLELNYDLVNEYFRKCISLAQTNDIFFAIFNHYHRIHDIFSDSYLSETKFNSIEEYQNNIQSDNLVISFIVLEELTVVIYVTKEDFNYKKIKISRNDMIKKTELVQKHIKNYSEELRKLNQFRAWRGFSFEEDDSDSDLAPDQLELLNTLDNISKDILDFDLLNHLPDYIRNICIIPDDIFHSFPFNLLRFKEDYLIRNYEINIKTNFFSVQENESFSITNAFLIGYSEKIENYPALPNTIKEIEKLENNLGEEFKITKSINPNISKSELIELMKKHQIAHFTGHGDISKNDPNSSGLVIIYNGEKEIINYLDLEKVDLSDLKFLSLASCWSGDTFVTNTKIPFGLPTIFKRVGVNCVLGSLWVVSDYLSSEFMSRFYSYLKDHSPSSALRRAILDVFDGKLIDDPIYKFDHPFFWAGFSIYV